METSVKVKTDLDANVKTIHGLLQKLTHEERMDYIKEMIPSLITAPHEITNSSQRLAEKHLTPFNNLSQQQRDLMNELSHKTEYLYKLMNEKEH